MPNITLQFRQLVEPHSTQKPTKQAQVDIYTQEAYRIYHHINSLKRFLLSIRPIYLNAGHGPRTTIKLNKDDPLFALLPNNLSQLTDGERDEIDFQAKLIIKHCIDRIKALEESETIRSSQQPHGFLKFFTSMITEDVLGVHRSSMTWLLNQQLTEVSKIQKEQQEIRLTREIEKSENQLSRSSAIHAPFVEEEKIELDAFEKMLSKEQMQMLEKENSRILENLNNTLNQIKSAEKALLEIATLQTQLTNHLAAQTLQTDRLYADAVATSETVERGNTQLLSAKERNRGSRRFILAFLLGASFVLLFLDWYS